MRKQIGAVQVNQSDGLFAERVMKLARDADAVIADNRTEEGRARNRRVELMKQ